MTEEARPRAGDWVEYIHPTGTGRKQRPRAHSYRTGRVVERVGHRELRVRKPCKKVGHAKCRCKTSVIWVPLDEDHIVGWWPKGTSKTAPRNRRRLEC